MKRTLVFVLLAMIGAFAQQVQVSKENRTITVEAEDTLKVPADIAYLKIGREDFAADYRSSFEANKAAMEQIVGSLHLSGVKDDEISTTTLTVENYETRTQMEEQREVPRDQAHRFLAFQMLTVSVPAESASRVMDAVAKAGANALNEPVWALKDEDSAQAQAGANALKKARQLADRMAQGLGSTLGELVFASNRNPEQLSAASIMNLGRTAEVTAGPPPNRPRLHVFKQAVAIQATVFATFSLK